MRTPVINVLAGLTIGAGVAVLVALSTPTAVVGHAYPMPTQVQEDEPGWDCATMGNRVCGPQVAIWPVGGVDVGDGSCWVEKVSSPATAEVICGDTGDRPRTDTADIGEVFGTSATECGWVASWGWRQGFAIEPAGCN